MTSQRDRSKGFSLVELIAVVLVLGLLLAIAAPRLDAGRGVEELGFSQQVLTDLRIAQRRALADRCEVRVTFTASGFHIDQRASLCSGPFSRPVAGTAGAASTLGGPPPAGMQLSASPAVFYFDGRGAAVDSPGGAPADISITAGLRQIQIVGTTGYASF
ncbi:MAG: prepilin-type N-terminal cleavage/methylation domain-containing protein [Woeseia sp.]